MMRNDNGLSVLSFRPSITCWDTLLKSLPPSQEARHNGGNAARKVVGILLEELDGPK